MRVIEPEPVKDPRQLPHVPSHVLPQPRVRLRPAAVAELDAIAPDDEVAADVGAGEGGGEVGEGVGAPDPAVVGEGEGGGGVSGGGLVGWEAGEEGFGEGGTGNGEKGGKRKSVWKGEGKGKKDK